MLELMGATPAGEMLPSILAKALAPVPRHDPDAAHQRRRVVAVRGAAASAGTTLPIVPPLALKATLANPAGPLTNLQPLRDQTMNQLYDALQERREPGAAAVHRLDGHVAARRCGTSSRTCSTRSTSIKDNTADSQITRGDHAHPDERRARSSPIHIPFGGDNHRDIGAGDRDDADRVGRGRRS